MGDPIGIQSWHWSRVGARAIRYAPAADRGHGSEGCCQYFRQRVPQSATIGQAVHSSIVDFPELPSTMKCEHASASPRLLLCEIMWVVDGLDSAAMGRKVLEAMVKFEQLNVKQIGYLKKFLIAIEHYQVLSRNMMNVERPTWLSTHDNWYWRHTTTESVSAKDALCSSAGSQLKTMQ